VHVSTIGPIQLRKTLLKGSNTRLPLWIVLSYPHQNPDPPHALALLAARSERPCRRRTAEQPVELTASDESRHPIPPAGRVKAQP
jgi:hypothetical protein